MSDLQIVKEIPPLKLDLGCGENIAPGYTGVDQFAPNCQTVDLFKFPWPWADNSVDALRASHFLEHIPAREVEAGDILGKRGSATYRLASGYIGKDMLCSFMDEAYRVLKPGGEFMVIVPNARSNRAFQDPTHRRFFVQESFYYFNKGWRELQKLGHYLCSCDFGFESGHTMAADLQALSPEVQTRKFNESWNVIYDWHMRLISNKPKIES